MSKDWTGSTRSSFATLGASNHTEHDREKHDYYATDPETIKPLVDAMTKHKEKMPRRIWENASGEGHLVKPLIEYGYTVVGSDLIQRTKDTIQFDFLEKNGDTNWVEEVLEAMNGEEIGILTNPPYKYAKEWVEKSMDYLRHKERLIMFLKIQFLEGQKRRELFEEYPPKYVFIFSKRQKCAMNGEFEKLGSSAACYAWFVWEKGFKGYPTIDWI